MLVGCRGATSGPGVAPAPSDEVLGANLSVVRVRVGFGPTNCWIAHRPGERDALVVDPGADEPKIRQALESRGLVCAAIVHTHGHGDHTGASRRLQASTGAVIYRHPRQGAVPTPSLATSHPGGEVRDLADGQHLGVGGMSFRVILTPGHAPGSVCLLGHGVLFSGDLLFRGNVGRTDLPGGSQSELVHSLKVRLASVPAETRVLPGHGEVTTMGAERR